MLRLRTLLLPLPIGLMLGCGRDETAAPLPQPVMTARAGCLSRFRGAAASLGSDAELSARLGGARASANAIGFFSDRTNDTIVGNDAYDPTRLGIAKRLGGDDGTLLVAAHDRLRAFSLARGAPRELDTLALSFGPFHDPLSERPPEVLVVEGDRAFVVRGARGDLAIHRVRLDAGKLAVDDELFVRAPQPLTGNAPSFHASVIGEELVVTFESASTIPMVGRIDRATNTFVAERPLFAATDIVDIGGADRLTTILACPLGAARLECRPRALLGPAFGWLSVGERVVVGTRDLVAAVEPKTRDVALHRLERPLDTEPLAVRQRCDVIDVVTLRSTEERREVRAERLKLTSFDAQVEASFGGAAWALADVTGYERVFAAALEKSIVVGSSADPEGPNRERPARVSLHVDPSSTPSSWPIEGRDVRFTRAAEIGYQPVVAIEADGVSGLQMLSSGPPTLPDRHHLDGSIVGFLPQDHVVGSSLVVERSATERQHGVSFVYAAGPITLVENHILLALDEPASAGCHPKRCVQPIMDSRSDRNFVVFTARGREHFLELGSAYASPIVPRGHAIPLSP